MMPSIVARTIDAYSVPSRPTRRGDSAAPQRAYPLAVQQQPTRHGGRGPCHRFDPRHSEDRLPGTRRESGCRGGEVGRRSRGDVPRNCVRRFRGDVRGRGHARGACAQGTWLANGEPATGESVPGQAYGWRFTLRTAAVAWAAPPGSEMRNAT